MIINMSVKYRSVFTFSAESEELAFNELCGLSVQFIMRLDKGVVLFGHDQSFFLLSEEVKKLIFIRHIFPVDGEFDLDGDVFERLGTHLSGYLESLDIALPVSVQVRSAGGDSRGFKAKIINFFTDRGYDYSQSQPVNIISVFLTEKKLYIGASNAAENLSGWAGGARHYAYRGDTFSRAEFKLLEAIELSGLELKSGQRALDLGAAPGGWTKVLSERGLCVTAVDPAEIEYTGEGVVHFKGLADEFFRQSNNVFDIIVNDMRMDVLMSASAMLKAADILFSGGFAVMTFKLPQKKPMGLIKKGFSILKERYDIVFARQLFHNRSEITLVLRKN